MRTPVTPPVATQGVSRRTAAAAWWGLGVAVALMVLAMAIPAVTGWNVRVRHFPPLHADWHPRLGWSTAAALAVGALGCWRAVDIVERMSWRRLLLLVFVTGVVWMLALALVDGSRGVGTILDTPYEYLRTARGATDLHRTLQEYVSRIPFSARPHNLPVHPAGHPPGALLFFVLLVRLGLGGGFAAGLVVTLTAATTAVAVMVTLRTLGAELMARRAAPFLVLGPAAVWQCVSADGMFAAVSAWGIAALAVAATRRSLAWSVLTGLLLGYAVMLSYGLPLLGVLAVAVLVLARSWWPVVPAALAALAVPLTFAAFGFDYLQALPALHQRYWEAVGGRRPAAYWWWGDLAALAFSAGPLAYAGLAHLVVDWRTVVMDRASSVAGWLAGAGFSMAALADASQMSRAEVERIWLPFECWALVGCALLPHRWRRGGLVLQVVFALLVQHLLATGW